MSEEKVINVVQSSLPPLDEYVEEISSIWETHWLTHTGPKHQELAKQLKEYLGVENIALFANGHLSLEMAIEALGIKGEVITTPFTFASTTQAIVRCGLTPVFCDIEPDTYTLDPEKIEALITERTSAILPVHVYGNVCNWREIERIAKKHDLKVIYDAAHAFGVEENGVGVGNFGDISMFSFHATKVFNTVEGGGLTYHNAALTKEFKALRQFGMYGKDVSDIVGTNAKMTEMHAAMGLCNLRHLSEEIEKRKWCVEKYRELLGDVPGIKLCPIQKNVKQNYAYFPVVFDEAEFGQTRDIVDQKLREHNIIARKYFYPLTSTFPVYDGRFDIQETPVASWVSERVLTLPLYAGLALEDVERICEIILKP